MFYHICQQKYHINRGDFNTIDNWFYEYGVSNLVYRRIYILAFLDYIKREKEGYATRYIKFGNKGLSLKLNEFITSYLEDQNLYAIK